jgi:hypothetical protein
MSTSSSERKKNISLAAVDRRLDDVHRLWHQAEDNYFEPDSFRLSIQSAIQTLRSVTFVLQNNKAIISDFDKWYTPWQEQMKSDKVMRWLVDARNRIEKEGDLNAASFIRARLIVSYLDNGPSIEVPSDLFKNVAELLGSTKSIALQKHIHENGTLLIERRWKENSLPDLELLDAVSHGYGVLSAVVADAHHQIGSTPPLVTHLKGHPLDPQAFGGKLPCMTIPTEPRQLLISLRDGSRMSMARGRVPYDADQAEASAKRYGFDQNTFNALKPKSAKVLIAKYFEMAREIFLVDGYHKTFLIPIKDLEYVGLYEIQARDQREKYLLMRRLASEVKAFGADAILMVGEVWMSKAETLTPYQRPSESPQRSEALMASIATKGAENFRYCAKIIRNGNHVKLENTVVSENEPQFIFSPFYAEWGNPVPEKWILAEEQIFSRYKSTQLGTQSRRGAKIGRNSVCPCGSGLKFKRCCLGSADSVVVGARD